MGTCLPWRVEAIDVSKKGGSFEGVVEWSEHENHENFLGKVLNQMVIKGTKELQDMAKKLRDKKRELFVVTITSF